MNEEIKREEWTKFLDEFSKRNERRPARVEIVGEEIGAQEAGRHLPLVGVSYEPKGSEAGDVVITFAGQTTADQRHVSHRLDKVMRIVPLFDEKSEEDKALEMESSDGTKAILVFERLPELPSADS